MPAVTTTPAPASHGSTPDRFAGALGAGVTAGFFDGAAAGAALTGGADARGK
jgi:hypothetical protein